MAEMKTNVLIKIVVIVALVAVAAVLIKTLTKSSVSSAVLGVVPVLDVPVADQDTTTETIATLTETVRELESRNKEIVEKSNEVLAQERKIKEKLHKELSRKITEDVTDTNREQKRATDEKFVKVLRQLDALRSNIADTERIGKNNTFNDDYPLGLGLSEEAMSGTPNGGWVMPINVNIDVDGALKENIEPLNAYEERKSEQKDKEEVTVIPYATLPKGATLMNGTAFTGLIGRIPINGQLRDPFNFKILVGKKNLAANGIYIPELNGMILGGVASGDWNLTCVRGDIKYATFVFEDGTISTYSGGGDEKIGELADESGIPCISGDLITNGVRYIGSSVALAALESAGEAAAASTTNTQFSNSGATVSIDSVGAFTLGNAIKGGARETRKWIDERQKNSFDSVFAPPGVIVSANILREIPINYDKNERKIWYGKKESINRISSLD